MRKRGCGRLQVVVADSMDGGFSYRSWLLDCFFEFEFKHGAHFWLTWHTDVSGDVADEVASCGGPQVHANTSLVWLS